MAEEKERFVPLSKYALNMAQVLVEDRDERLIEPHHLLFGLIHARNSIASTVLKEFGITQENFFGSLDKYPVPKPSPETKIELSKATKDVLVRAVDEARRMRLRIIGTGQLLIGVITKRTPPIEDILEQLNIKSEAIIDRTRQLIILEKQGQDKTSYKLHEDNWWYQFTSVLYRLIGVEPLSLKPSSFSYNDQSDVDQLELINWSLQMYPNSPHLLKRKGALHLEEKDYAAAIQSYSAAVRLKPDFIVAYFNRGWSYLLISDYQNTIADFSHVIELNPNSLEAHYYRAYAWMQIGEYDQALAEFSEVIEQKPDNNYYICSLEGRSFIYFRQEEFNKAIADCDAILSKEPENTQALHNRGTNYAYLGKYVEAEADFQEQLRLCPESASAFGNLAWLNLLRENYDESLRFGQEALKYDTKYGPVYYSIGAALAAKGDHEGAVANFQKAFEYWKDVERKPTDRYAKEMRDYIAQWGKADNSSVVE